MANTIKREGNTIELSGLDSDWLWSDTFTEEEFMDGIPINFILFDPGADDEECNLYNSEGGPRCFTNRVTSVDDQRVLHYYGNVKKLFLDFSAGTYASANTAIIIELKQTY